VRQELGINAEILLFHSSNLRPVKRIDHLLEVLARVKTKRAFKLLVLAGESFQPFEAEVRRLGLGDHLIIRTKVSEIEDYLQAADLGVFTSEVESFGLSILECMYFGVPCVAPRVGGIPEVIDSGRSGILIPFGDLDAYANTVQSLVDNDEQRTALGEA